MEEQRLTTIIHRDRHGKMKDKRRLSVPLTSQLGDSETLAMSQKGVTDNLARIDATFEEYEQTIAQMQSDIDSIIAGSASASLKADKTTVFKGVLTQVKLTASCIPDADEIIIKKGNNVVTTGSGGSLTADVYVDADATYTAEFHVSNGTRMAEVKIKAVSPVFFGAGLQEEDVTNQASIRASVAGTYSINVPNDNMYIFFIIPANMTAIKSAAEGPNTFPLYDPTDTTREVAGTTVNYKVYQSNSLQAGDYIITLT